MGRFFVLYSKIVESGMTKKLWFRILIVLILIVCLVFLYPTKIVLDVDECVVLAVAFVCAVLWVTEWLPIPITSLIPFVCFPLFGVLDGKIVAQSYGHPMILLLMGGFILSTALEHSGVHKRFALGILSKLGTQPKNLIGGFLLIGALCSMWISNTATTLMLLPIAGAIVQQRKEIAPSILLAIAYGSSIGGMATPIGTPPNMILMGMYKESVNQDISFVMWMTWVLPVVCTFLPLVWWWLCYVSNTQSKNQIADTTDIVLEDLGIWSTIEKRVVLVFSITALLWVTRNNFWGKYVPLAGDETVALLAVIFLFVIPSGEESGTALLNWEKAKNIPWGLLILFGGGIALAKGFQVSGLSEHIGIWLVDDVGLRNMPLWLSLCILCLIVTFLTEITSNTATTTLLMPILIAAGLAANIDPLLWMLPAALSASCAFMLPVATAPNAIVFATGHLTTQYMAKTGFVVNLIGVVVISLWMQWSLSFSF